MSPALRDVVPDDVAWLWPALHRWDSTVSWQLCRNLGSPAHVRCLLDDRGVTSQAVGELDGEPNVLLQVLAHDAASGTAALEMVVDTSRPVEAGELTGRFLHQACSGLRLRKLSVRWLTGDASGLERYLPSPVRAGLLTRHARIGHERYADLVICDVWRGAVESFGAGGSR